jgi:hypothetical protein
LTKSRTKDDARAFKSKKKLKKLKKILKKKGKLLYNR